MMPTFSLHLFQLSCSLLCNAFCTVLNILMAVEINRYEQPCTVPLARLPSIAVYTLAVCAQFSANCWLTHCTAARNSAIEHELFFSQPHLFNIEGSISAALTLFTVVVHCILSCNRFGAIFWWKIYKQTLARRKLSAIYMVCVGHLYAGRFVRWQQLLGSNETLSCTKKATVRAFPGLPPPTKKTLRNLTNFSFVAISMLTCAFVLGSFRQNSARQLG